MEGGNKMDLVAIIWLGLLVAFLVAEAVCSVHLVSIWFALGTVAALVVYMLSGPVWLQVLVFAVVSGALLVALWPLTKKFLTPHLTATNIDSVIGSTGRVTAAIDNTQAQGQVKLGAMEWTARSSSGEPIAEGTLVRVDKIEGVKVFVSLAEETVTV
jgi:membrane protein implicated in regulation of membrane protease activity